MNLTPGYDLDVAVDRLVFGRKFPSDYQVRKAIKAQLGKLIRGTAETRGHWILVNNREGVYVNSLNGRASYHFDVNKYSKDPGDALRLADHMRKDGFTFRVHQFSGPTTDAMVSFVCCMGPCSRHPWNKRENHHGAYEISGETLPLAIVKAAFIAKRVKP